MNSLIKSILGTALGIMFAALVFVFASKYVMSGLSDISQEMVLQNQQRLEASKARQAAEEIRLATMETERRAEEARQRTLAQKKESAWLMWYQEPDGCDNYRNDAHMVECINHQVRAKREFEVLWSQGQIDAGDL